MENNEIVIFKNYNSLGEMFADVANVPCGKSVLTSTESGLTVFYKDENGFYSLCDMIFE